MSGMAGASGSAGLAGSAGFAGGPGEICTPRPPILETDFPPQTNQENNINHEVVFGSISLLEQWTHCWRPWETQFPHSGSNGWMQIPIDDVDSTVLLSNFPNSPFPSLYINSFGHDNYLTDQTGTGERLHYLKIIDFNASVGWVVAWNNQVIYNQPVVDPLYYDAIAFDIHDGAHGLSFDFRADSVHEAFSNDLAAIDSNRHSYRVAAEPTPANPEDTRYYTLFIDGSPASSEPDPRWPFTNVHNATDIEWGDLSALDESVAHWSNVCYYTGGPSVPFHGSGNYSTRLYDLTADDNLVGRGNYITFNGQEPSGQNNTILFQTRTGASLNLEDGSWSAWADAPYDTDGNLGYMIQSPAARYLQIMVLLSTTDQNVTPRVDDLSIDHDVCTTG
jgi:hypothetical protein